MPKKKNHAAAWLKVLTAGGSRYQSVAAARRLKDVMQCNGRRWIPLTDHAEQWQQPQHTRKNISRCSPRRITNPPPTQTHIYGPHMGYISWRLGLKVPISPLVHIYSPTVHVPCVTPKLNPYNPLAACVLLKTRGRQ